MGAFADTKELFSLLLTCKFPMNYEAWHDLPHDKKCAALYLNFYSAITNAYTKTQNTYVDEEDCLGMLIQGLMKNVDIIDNDPKRYTANYVYRIAFNAIGSFTRRHEKAKHRYEDMAASVYKGEDGCQNYILDILRDESVSVEDRCCYHDDMCRTVWEIIDDLSEDEREIVDCILMKRPTPEYLKSKRRSIMRKLRKKFKNIYELYLSDDIEDDDDVVLFGDLLASQRPFSSAVVTMYDGIKAMYYGEQKIVNGKKIAVFFGPSEDYEIPVDRAADYYIEDVEYDD